MTVHVARSDEMTVPTCCDSGELPVMQSAAIFGESLKAGSSNKDAPMQRRQTVTTLANWIAVSFFCLCLAITQSRVNTNGRVLSDHRRLVGDERRLLHPHRPVLSREHGCQSYH